MDFDDLDDLYKYIEKVVEEAIDKVSTQILLCLRKHIWNDTYQKKGNSVYQDVFSPSTSKYDMNDAFAKKDTGATFDFLNAFELTNIKKTTNKLTRDLIYNYTTMRLGMGSYMYQGEKRFYGIHQNSYGEDLREELFDILDKRGNPELKRRRSFWKEFVKETNSKLNSWIKQAFLSQGLEVEVIGGGIDE